MELYADIFLQGFLARIVPWHQELLLRANLLFGHESATRLMAIASLGACLGSALLYAGGWMLRRHLALISTQDQQARSLRGERWAKRALPLVLLGAALPYIGWIVVFASGFYRVRLWLVVPIVLAAELLLRLSML